MNVEKNLMNLGIVQTRKFEFKETNFVAKTVAEKLADNVLELGNSYNELYMRIYNCNMSYANVASKFGNVVYFYPNNTLYFDEKFDITKIDEKVIQECIHYLQNFKKFDGSQQRIGVCNFAEFKIYCLGLNEAVTQYIASKAIGEKPHIKNNDKISIYTISDKYYPYLTSLVIQLLFLVGEKNFVNSAIYGADTFENDLYNTFEENTNKILNYFDNILDENNKIDRSEEKIIELYLKTQKDMCTTYFDKIYNRVNTLKEVENYSHKLNEYQNIIGKIIGQSQENDELNKYIKNMESKMNRKYVDIYAKQSKQSLIVVYQSKIQKLFRKVVNWFGSRA